MDEQLYVAILDKNKLRIMFGNEAHLHIEVWGGDEFINFRVAGASEGKSVELKVSESYNQHSDEVKAVNFIIKEKDK